ncbi:phospholipid scramblase-related protein [Streptomyces specialis]|uniref:phospholipid scramblase-related protein n=1 Tax=Streptomyces specialis TaxID=498367 RepID=UPI00073ED878|nr:phospholipid scramblase-related protein [Streptomyces specialis]
MTAQTNVPAGWYGDPHGAPDLMRWWDGTRWTEHTRPGPRPRQEAGTVPGTGGGTLFGEPVLAVDPRAKVTELINEYGVSDQQGRAIGSVVQVGRSPLTKVARFLSRLDQFTTHHMEIRDAHEQPVLMLTRPAKFPMSRVLVTRPDGRPVGEIVQQGAFGEVSFAIRGDGRVLGVIKAEDRRGASYAVVDDAGAEIARITRTREGAAKIMFATADHYVLQMHRPLADPLLSLVVAAGLTVDIALKQDARGLG